MKRYRHYLYKILRNLLTNAFLAAGILFILCPSCFLSGIQINSLWPDLIKSFAFCVVLSNGNQAINKYLNGKVSWVKEPVRRLALNTLIMFAYSFLASILTIILLDIAFFSNDNYQLSWHDFIGLTYLPLIVTAVLVTVQTSWGFLHRWRASALEAERLKTENMASRYEALKNQVNPHFLFNSLNTLTALIYEDADTAAQFVVKLSAVYRYVLDHQDQEVIPMTEEIAFIKSYIFLQKMRFEENLQIQLDIPDVQRRNLVIPPLAIQMLLENAIKHNEISNAYPLLIRIYSENDEFLVVQNNLQPKSIKASSTGRGLQNIQLRFEYLSQKRICIIKTQQDFIVKLPLLRLQLP